MANAAIAAAMARPSPDPRGPCGLRVPGEGQGRWPCAACKACNAAGGRLLRSPCGPGGHRPQGVVAHSLRAEGTRPRSRLGACRTLGRARAWASCGARLGVGEACGGATQRADNDVWRRKALRPFGLGLFRGACVVANARRAARHGCALRLACAPKQAQRRPDPKPGRFLALRPVAARREPSDSVNRP